MVILLSEINTIEELKARGSFKEVTNSLNELIPLKSRGWKDLWNKIIKLKRLAEPFNDNFNEIITADITSEYKEAFLLFNSMNLIEFRKCLWFTLVTRRAYNFYISSLYEGIDLFNKKGKLNEI